MDLQKHTQRLLRKSCNDVEGMLFNSIKKLLDRSHSSLDIDDDAVEFVADLSFKLIAMLFENPLPRCIQDVEDRVLTVFPTPIDKWALRDAKEIFDRGKKRSMLPVDKLHQFMQKEYTTLKIDSCVTMFVIAIMEYMVTDILKLTANYVKNTHHVEITLQDVKVAMCTDKALMDLFFIDENDTLLETEQIPGTVYTYDRVVKQLITEERNYLRDLHMITKVFQEELRKIVGTEIDEVFINITEIYDLTVTLISNLEDIVEMAQEETVPHIGNCFYELAEALEFDVYIHYAKEIDDQKAVFKRLMSRPEVQTLLTAAGQGFSQAVRYFLPKLLLTPLFHCYLYFDYLTALHKLSSAAHDAESLQQVQGLLTPLESALNTFCPLQNKIQTSQTRRRLTLEKLNDLKKTVEHWELKDFGQFCNEFIKDDIISKYTSSKKRSERRAILFDGILILCKHQTSSYMHHNHNNYSYREYRLKERLHMRKVEIRDLPDNDEIKFAFEIVPRNEPSIILIANSLNSKLDWLANLVMLNTKPMFDRILDSILLNLENQNPLKLPSVHLYRFAEPDSKTNIVFEHREASDGVPLIKGATLLKLVERLTFHLYADMTFMRTFLTTYRSFCSPSELLDLLIDRFDIPEPNIVYGCDEIVDYPCDVELSGPIPEDWKRYRKEYSQPIKFRVLNVLKHWIEYHFYDFQNEPSLLFRLQEFLTAISQKKMKKWADTLLKLISRKSDHENGTLKIRIMNADTTESPPPIVWHIKNLDEDDFGILTLHPLELARQLTLLEFDLYKLVRPSELVDSVWTKKDKEISSPNLLKIIKHTTNFTRWLEKNIVEAENFEERIAIVSRIIEVMISLQDLNNFNGILAIVSAMGSASVFRLKWTFQSLPRHLEKVLEDCRELNTDHFKKYQEKLRTSNPPCVPFLGMCLTNILHIEEGNPNFLQGTNLINFSKRRKVAEITGEIQQFQNKDYVLQVEPKIRRFLDNLCPFADMRDTDISNYLYDKSLDIEPRGCKQPPKFPRKWPDIPLKSPGIKPRYHQKQIYGSSITMFKTDNDEISPSALADTFMNPSQTPSPTQRSPSAFSTGPFSGFHNWLNSSTRSNSIISLASTIKSNVISPKSAIPPQVPSTSELPTNVDSTSDQMDCTPPPLPPRIRRRDGSVSETPPLVPPRDDRLPPPLPPRFSTLPRLNTDTSQSSLLLRRSLAAAASSK